MSHHRPFREGLVVLVVLALSWAPSTPASTPTHLEPQPGASQPDAGSFTVTGWLGSALGSLTRLLAAGEGTPEIDPLGQDPSPDGGEGPTADSGNTSGLTASPVLSAGDEVS